MYSRVEYLRVEVVEDKNNLHLLVLRVNRK
jgi:hypothetical protein